MEKNDFLLYNEIIYHIHTCQDMDDLKRSILAQVKLMIPYTYASLIVVEIDPETREIRHSDPFCLPDSFTALEEAWIDRDHQDESFWVSHAPESIVVRSSDLTGEARLESPIFQELYQQYNIYDTMSMNLAYDHQVMALLTLYRTRADGVFTDQEAFYLRALAGHVNYAYYTMAQREASKPPKTRTPVPWMSALEEIPMEKNDFLLYNEIIYHIHTCQDMDDLKRSILAQVKLMIPYTYASLIVVEIDPETREIRHSDPFCLPDSFTALEEAWIDRDHQDESFWVSHAPESIVVRSSDLTGEARLESPIFQELYQQYNIYDTMSMNLAYDHQVMALLTLYRTRADGVFTDQEAFYLRALAGHVNYAYYTMAQREASKPPKTRTMEELVQDYELTRRETEILGLVFQDLNNEEILDQLHISRHTLLKHLQNLYRKCGVSSRWDLLKLRP